MERLRRATGLQRAGRLAEAEALYREVIAKAPREPNALRGLAIIRSRRGDLDGAIALFERAIKAGANGPDVHVALADTLQQRGRPDRARKAAERALAIDPSYAPAHLLIASCHERLGRLDDALAAVGRARAAAPEDANAAIVEARLLGRTGRAEDARTQLEEVVARPSLPPFLRQLGHSELGNVLDRLGAYDEAFEAFSRAGIEAAADPVAASIDRERWPRRIRAYRAGLTAEVVGRFADETFEERAPVFLVGFPRSGTTMTEQILAAHPEIITTDEKELIRPLKQEVARALGRENDEDMPAMLAAIDRDLLGRLRRQYWKLAARETSAPIGERTFVDKLPLNLIDLGFINVVFPDARVIVALRDPRDVCLSCFIQWFGFNTAMVNFLELGRTVGFYDQVMDLWLHLRPMVTLDWMEVRYEDTVLDLEGQGRRILDHLGRPWSDELLRFHEKSRERFISTPSFSAVTEKVHRRAVARWRNYARHFEPHQARLARYVEAFGYEAG